MRGERWKEKEKIRESKGEGGPSSERRAKRAPGPNGSFIWESEAGGWQRFRVSLERFRIGRGQDKKS